jgi:hypothetical protein
MQRVVVRVPRQLFAEAKADLMRPHPFAGERVGFFSTRSTVTESVRLVHCIGYHRVEDNDYLKDESVGACIGSKVITHAMARSRTSSVGQLHVHWHGGGRFPGPSGVDRRSLPSLAKSLRNANSKEVHGWVILGEVDAWASLLIPGRSDPIIEPLFSIVGFPIARDRPIAPARLSFEQFSKEGRYHRQNFLGPNSDAMIARSKIGVIGLGGGGSHIVQQLVHVGFRNFVLFDEDRIARTNLNRLVGATAADVRKKMLKVDIAERLIRSLHPNAVVDTHVTKWETGREALLECDIIFGCLDSLIPRRDVEAFCRRNLIPYIDVGMDVLKNSSAHEIYGQVILSMPGCPCMMCMGFLDPNKMGEEAAKYGEAGTNPQVVWSNGMICSAAVGVAVDLLTDWSRATRGPIFLNMIGSRGTLSPDRRLSQLDHMKCRHYPLSEAGDPVRRPL